MKKITAKIEMNVSGCRVKVGCGWQLTVVLEVVVSEVVSGERFVPSHAGPDRLEHLWLLVKLVIRQVNFLELFSDGHSVEHLHDAFVFQFIASKNQLLQLALLKYEHLEKCTAAVLVDTTVAQGKRFDHFVVLQALA